MEIFELGHLFEAVQMQNILSDGKTFPDCLPKKPLEAILEQYEQVKNKPKFDLKTFVLDNFDLPTNPSVDFKSDSKQALSAHITSLWNVLTRQPDTTAQGSLMRATSPTARSSPL